MTTETILSGFLKDIEIKKITKCVCTGHKNDRQFIDDMIQETILILLEKKVDFKEIYDREPKQVYSVYAGFCWKTYNANETRRKYGYQSNTAGTRRYVSFEAISSTTSLPIDIVYEITKTDRRNFEYQLPDLLSPNENDTAGDNYNKKLLCEYLEGNTVRGIADATGINYVTVHKDIHTAAKKIYYQYKVGK